MSCTLESYLRECLNQGIIDFNLRASVAPDGTVEFYMHPEGKNGVTLDCTVSCDSVHVKDTTRV